MNSLKKLTARVDALEAALAALEDVVARHSHPRLGARVGALEARVAVDPAVRGDDNTPVTAAEAEVPQDKV